MRYADGIARHVKFIHSITTLCSRSVKKSINQFNAHRKCENYTFFAAGFYVPLSKAFAKFRKTTSTCFKKYNLSSVHFAVSDKSASLRSYVYTFMYSCDSSCQLKHVSSQFTSSLFPVPLHLRHLSNCSYQMHLRNK